MSIGAVMRADSPIIVLAVTQGRWGERIANNVSQLSPSTWTVHRWAAPRVLPIVVEDPIELLPPNLPKADLVLALGETPAVAQLLPDIVQLTGAKAVIAPIDRTESLPPGLVIQLRGWLADLGATVIFPKPFCSLTETTYNQPPITATYDNEVIRAFARHFGRPELHITVNETKQISSVTVTRNSACGCASFVAQGLINCPVEEAEHQAGMLHHHYPCLASMTQDADYHDTLMHVSGHILRSAVKAQIADHLEPVPYLQPMGKVSDATPQSTPPRMEA